MAAVARLRPFLLELRVLPAEALQRLLRSLAAVLLPLLLDRFAVLSAPGVQQVLGYAEAGSHVGDGSLATRFQKPNGFTLEVLGVLLSAFDWSWNP